MKKAIFIVDDFKDNVVVTFLEKFYSKAFNKMISLDAMPGWMREIGNLLHDADSDYIKFISIENFIKNSDAICDGEKDVFYFISCYHNLDTFHVSNFLMIDPNFLDLLTKYSIPIILDTSMEMNDHYESAKEVLDDHHWILNFNNGLNFSYIKDLKFIIVGSNQIARPIVTANKIKKQFVNFPGPFFSYNSNGNELHQLLISQREQLFKEINNKKIDSNTLVWQSYSKEPRINRSLFYMKVEHENLVNGVGRYSRLLPAKDAFYKHCKRLDLDIKKMDFVNDYQISKLDEIKIIDADTFVGVLPFPQKDFMFSVVLETFWPVHSGTFANTNSFLTEKTAMAIISGVPFIPLGGQHIGTLLKYYGFREYKYLEFPNQPNFLDELSYVVEKIKFINSLSVSQKQEVYDTWRHTIRYNYDRYLTIDHAEEYLRGIQN